MTAPGEGQLVLKQAGAAVFAWEVGSLSASQCLRVSSQHLPAAPFGHRSCSLLPCAGLLGSRDPQGHKCDRSEGLVSGDAFLEAPPGHRTRSSFRQMSAGNGNQLQRPRGDMTGLLGNDTQAVRRNKCCDCCSQGIRKICVAAHGSKNRGGLPKVLPRLALGRGRIPLGKARAGSENHVVHHPWSRRKLPRTHSAQGPAANICGKYKQQHQSLVIPSPGYSRVVLPLAV